MRGKPLVDVNGTFEAPFEALGCLGIKFTFCLLPLNVVDGVAQTECSVVVEGVVEDTEFCLLGGPKAGKSS